MDLIEIYNARDKDVNNQKAEQLAIKFQKKSYYGSDARLSGNFLDVVVQFEKHEDLKNTLLHSDITHIKLKKTVKIKLIVSQYIKTIKTYDVPLFIRLRKSLIGGFIKMNLFQEL